MKQRRVLLAVVLAAALLLSGFSCRRGSTASEPDALYKAGTYTGKAKGMNGDVTVSVVFTEHAIAEIEIVNHSETKGVSDPAFAKIPAAVIENQSLGVDVIAGATLTSNAILAAVADCVTQAGGDAEALKNRPAGPKAPGETVRKSADVVVVGGGGAGLSAAVAAAQSGASVILIEKTAALGGNTIRAGGPYNAVDSDRQAKVPAASDSAMQSIQALLDAKPQNDLHQQWINRLQTDLAAYRASGSTSLFDCVALHVLQTYTGGDYVGDLRLIEKLCGESLDAAKWLESNGLVWRDEISTVAGGLWPRAHTPVNAAGSDYILTNMTMAKNLGVEIVLECAAEQLVTEGGRVVGVRAEMAGGTPVELTAVKNVVLASGGFAANPAMRKQYVPSLSESLPTTNSPANVGDGIVMAQGIGANLVGMEWIQSLPLGDPKTGALNGWVGGDGVEYYYQINKQGKRFMPEDGRRDVMTAALLKQTDSYSYVVADSRSIRADGTTIWGDKVDELVADGKVFRADTIEQLAGQIGIDPAVFKKTHDDFNSYARAGYDPEFGRTLFGEELTQGPFYASPRVPTVHHTMGGVQIDLEGRVLRADGSVIEGLYAAGEVTGGIHGSNRLGGNALVDIHVFGRTAGTNAAK